MKRTLVFYILFCSFFIVAEDAHAYLDPGVGSVLLQALAAGLLGLGVFWRKVAALLKKVFSAKEK